MQTLLYRQQHGEILRHLEQISRMMNDASEQDISLELARLAGIVKLHLSLEDRNMYPRLLDHREANVRETAEKFMQTMGALAPAYVAFHEKWIQSGAIGAERAAFMRDFTAVRDALRSRIDRENRELYDLIDDKGVELAS